MRRFAILLVLAATLATSACADAPPISAGAAPSTTALDRAANGLTEVEQRFAAARAIVDLVPLTPDQAARVRSAEAIAVTALAAARTALTIADRIAALRRADAAADRIDAATGISTDASAP